MESNASIIKLSQAERMLAEITTVQDAAELIDYAEAGRVYAKQIGLGLSAQNHAAAIKLRAQRAAGELLSNMEKAKGGQPYQDGSTPYQVKGVETYSDMGISYKDAHVWQTIAKVPEEKLD